MLTLKTNRDLTRMGVRWLTVLVAMNSQEELSASLTHSQTRLPQELLGSSKHTFIPNVRLMVNLRASHKVYTDSISISSETFSKGARLQDLIITHSRSSMLGQKMPRDTLEI